MMPRWWVKNSIFGFFEFFFYIFQGLYFELKSPCLGLYFWLKAIFFGLYSEFFFFEKSKVNYKILTCTYVSAWLVGFWTVFFAKINTIRGCTETLHFERPQIGRKSNTRHTTETDSPKNSKFTAIWAECGYSGVHAEYVLPEQDILTEHEKRNLY